MTSGDARQLKLTCTTKRTRQGRERLVLGDRQRRKRRASRPCASSSIAREDAHDAQERQASKATVKSRQKALKKGKYTLRIAVTQKGKAKLALTRTVRLK